MDNGDRRKCLGFEVDEAHDRMYEAQVERVSSLQQTQAALGDKLDGASTILSEVCGKLYDRKVQRVESSDAGDNITGLFDTLEDDVRFRRLQRICKANPRMAARIASTMMQPIIKALPDKAQDEQDEQDQQDQQDQQNQQGPQGGVGVGNAGDDLQGDAEGTGNGPGDTDGDDHHGAWAGGSGDDVDGDDDALGQALNEDSSLLEQALENAAEDGENVHNVAGAFGLDNPESREEHEQLKDLLDALDDQPALYRIMELAGRLGRIAEDKARYNLIKNRGKREGVERGGDVKRAVLKDLALFANPRSRALGLLKVASEDLLLHKRETHEPMGRGPVIFCADMSGSMTSASEEWVSPTGNELSRLEWTKALLLSMARYACIQRREFMVIWWDDTINHVNHYPVGSPPTALLKELKVQAWGGTDFIKPLVRAINEIDSNPNFEKADIIFLTDGEPANGTGLMTRTGARTANGEWFEEQCDRLSINSLAIVIGNKADKRHEFCDSLINIPDVDPARATEVLDGLE
jgi:hypothetical protein